MLFFWILFVGIDFVEVLFVSSIISSNVIIELSIILPKYLSFSQLHVAGFQVFQIFTLTQTAFLIPILIRITFFTITLTFAFS